MNASREVFNPLPSVGSKCVSTHLKKLWACDSPPSVGLVSGSVGCPA